MTDGRDGASNLFDSDGVRIDKGPDGRLTIHLHYAHVETLRVHHSLIDTARVDATNVNWLFVRSTAVDAMNAAGCWLGDVTEAGNYYPAVKS